MKVAIVHDWLTNLGGAERVVYELHKLYPDAPIYTSVYDPEALPMFNSADIRTTWLQKLPFGKYRHQLWAAFRPRAFRNLQLEGYDVVISSSSAESKQITVADDAHHISYCHTPIRYYWSHYEAYKKDPGFGWLNPFVKLALPLVVRPLRKSDYKAAQNVDTFIANSSTVQERIATFYDRESTVLHPPVDTDRFKKIVPSERSGYVVAGRQIPYKRFDLAIKACNELGLPLTVIGNGPEHETLRALAGPTIRFERQVSDAEMPAFFQHAKGFIFAAEEDFGIVPIEAMSAGCPVIAFAEGGAKDWLQDHKNGVLFHTQTTQSLVSALKKFDALKLNDGLVAATALKFDEERFRLKMHELVQEVVQ